MRHVEKVCKCSEEKKESQVKKPKKPVVTSETVKGSSGRDR